MGIRRVEMRAWLLAARPKTLPAAIVPVWVGSALAWKLTGSWSPGLAAWALFGALCIQIATNLFNDALDFRKGADTPARHGPRRVTAAGLLRPGTVLAMGVVMLLAASAFGVPLIAARGWPILAIGLPSLYFAWGYTGGPFPLAYRGLGELFVVVFFGFVAVAGTVFVNTGQWFWLHSLPLGFQVGCLSTALIAINNLRDIAEDSRTGKRTLAARFGVGFAKWEIAGLYLAPLVAGLAASSTLGLGAGDWIASQLSAIVVMVLGAALAGRIWRTAPGPVYNKYLAMAAGLLLLFAVSFTLFTPAP